MTEQNPLPVAGDLSGRTVVITGGNRGIGEGIARAVVQAGGAVVVWARDESRSAETVAGLESMGGTAAAFSCDVSDEEAVDAAMAATLERFGTIDSLVANAGIGGGASFCDMTFEQWRKVLSVNLDGAFLTLRAAARHLVERGEGGSLVGVSSTSFLHGAPRNEAYSVSKSGIVALMRGLAVEFAGDRIRCNTLVPGWTETDMTAPLQQWDRFMDATIGRTPMRRWGTPDDMGAAAVFLIDPAHQFHTGDLLVVDGGYTIF